LGQGMIDQINRKIDAMSYDELRKLASQDRTEVHDYFIQGDRLVVNTTFVKVTRTISSLRVGKYYFPLHEYLKKRLRDLRGFYGKNQKEKSK